MMMLVVVLLLLQLVVVVDGSGREGHRRRARYGSAKQARLVKELLLRRKLLGKLLLELEVFRPLLLLLLRLLI